MINQMLQKIIILFFVLTSVSFASDFVPTDFTIGPSGGDLSNSIIIARGSIVARKLADRAADTIKIADYGAKCDSTTDDTLAINRAATVWRAAGLNHKAAVLEGMHNGNECKITGPLNFTGSTATSPTQTIRDLQIYAIYSANGPVGTLGTITAGAGGTPGTYTSVPLTGGSGSGCTAASVTVNGSGVVSAVTLPNGGCGAAYAVGDTLSAASGNIGSVTGFSVLVATTSGGAAIDATGNRFVDFQNVTVRGDCTTIPNVGIAIGRITPNVSADRNTFHDPVTTGCFILSGFYNGSSEVTSYFHTSFTNQNTASTGNCYGVIMDGANHFNWSSTFTTVTLPLDTNNSFNENNFFGGDIRSASNINCIPLWVEAAHSARFYDFYIDSGNTGLTGGSGIAFYSSDTTEVTDSFYFDGHIESLPDHCFFLTGPNATPTLNGFTYTEHNSQCQTYIFKTDTNITGVTLNSLRVVLQNIGGVGTATLIDAPSKYTLSIDRVDLPSLANWLNPAILQPGGTVCLAGSCQAIVAMASVNRNPDFVLDQPNEGANYTVANNKGRLMDGWTSLATGNPTARYTVAKTSTTPPTGYGFYAHLAVTITQNLSTSQFSSLQSIIEGSDVIALQLGTAQAQPMSISFMARANNTGTYNVGISNGAQSRSYITDYSISAANTWQSFCVTIPGDTNGVWTAAPDVNGLRLFFTTGAGSTYQTTANAWQGGQFLGDASAFNFLNTASATLDIAAVHFVVGPVCQPYAPRTFGRELEMARHFYVKSFDIGQKAVTNSANTNGATSFFATQATSGIPVQFPVPMFAAVPSMTFYSTNAATANCYDSTASADVGAASAVNLGRAGFFLNCASSTSGHQNQVHWTADSGF